MLFKDYHIPMIRSGSKTVTRREWADNYHGPNVGTVVAAKTDLLKPDDECDCFIRITGEREEYLGEITEASARREGDYDGVAEFRDGYEDVYGEGSWDPDTVVTVVQFEYVGESRPGDDDGGEFVDDHEDKLLPDGGHCEPEMERRQRTVAETQTAGFGLANGKVVQLLILEFNDDPAITVRHEHVDHPDPFDDRDPRTTTVEKATVRPTADSVNRKIEIGTAHGRDRVIAESHDHSLRVYVRHERKDGGWTEQSAWELHPATGITQTAGEASTDGGQVLNETERREELAYGDRRDTDARDEGLGRVVAPGCRGRRCDPGFDCWVRGCG